MMGLSERKIPIEFAITFLNHIPWVSPVHPRVHWATAYSCRYNRSATPTSITSEGVARNTSYRRGSTRAVTIHATAGNEEAF